MYVTIDPKAPKDADGNDFAMDVWAPQGRASLAIRMGVATEVPGWAEASVNGLEHVVECDVSGVVIGAAVAAKEEDGGS